VTRTLLVDGNSLLNTGFHGIKNLYNGDDHIGGLYHFLNTLRKHIDSYFITKIVVFWDGKDNVKPRLKFYPDYKLNRRLKTKSTDEVASYSRQKIRTQEYLEELYVRHAAFDNCEADDCIAYYCNQSPEEEIIILTSDRDLLQLITPKTSIHIISLNKLFKWGEKVPLNGIYIPHTNVRLAKTICGDSSDNIYGIKMVGIKSLVKIHPPLLEEEVSLEELIKTLNNKDKKTKKEQNILNGVSQQTKPTIDNKNLLNTNYNIIGVGKQFLTPEAVEGIKELAKEAIDPEGRHWKNALGLMMSDGILNILPKKDDSWVDFVRPFLRLSRIEKDFYKNKNN
jgi:5'-3' exonuclease|tara:strand:+ start:434 stop:1447 length:1014 start_codon:yes stop_codon:yes gene_type:complete